MNTHRTTVGRARSIELEDETDAVGSGPVRRMDSVEEMVEGERDAVEAVYGPGFTALTPQQWQLSLGDQINLVVTFPASGYPDVPVVPTVFISDLEGADPKASRKADLIKQLPLLLTYARYVPPYFSP